MKLHRQGSQSLQSSIDLAEMQDNDNYQSGEISMQQMRNNAKKRAVDFYNYNTTFSRHNKK